MVTEFKSNVKLNAKVDPKMTQIYKDKELFPEKLAWAKEHVKGRNIKKEIEQALQKDKNH